MSTRYAGTVSEKLTPLFTPQALHVLKRRGIDPEKYTLWLYHRSYGPVSLSKMAPVLITALLIFLIITAIVDQLEKNPVSQRTLLLVLSCMLVVFLVMFFLVRWTRRYSKSYGAGQPITATGILTTLVLSRALSNKAYGGGALNERMMMRGFMREMQENHISRISDARCRAIIDWEPRLERYKIERTPFRVVPIVPPDQQKKAEKFIPAQRFFAWLTVVFGFLIFFVPDALFYHAVAFALIVFGFFCLLGSIAAFLVGQITIGRTQNYLIIYGPPAKVFSTLYILFSLGIIFVGLFGFLSESL